MREDLHLRGGQGVQEQHDAHEFVAAFGQRAHQVGDVGDEVRGVGEVDAAQTRAQGNPAAPVRLVQGVALRAGEHVGGHEDPAAKAHVPDARRVLGQGAQDDGLGGQDLGRARVLKALQERSDRTNQATTVDDEGRGAGHLLGGLGQGGQLGEPAIRPGDRAAQARHDGGGTYARGRGPRVGQRSENSRDVARAKRHIHGLSLARRGPPRRRRGGRAWRRRPR